MRQSEKPKVVCDRCGAETDMRWSGWSCRWVTPWETVRVGGPAIDLCGDCHAPLVELQTQHDNAVNVYLELC